MLLRLLMLFRPVSENANVFPAPATPFVTDTDDRDVSSSGGRREVVPLPPLTLEDEGEDPRLVGVCEREVARPEAGVGE